MIDTNIIIYLLGLAAVAGGIATRISQLEKKVDNLNSMLERVSSLETDVKNIWKYISELE